MIENEGVLGLDMRIGIVVNPDAGLGGRLGFKGSDGRAKEARDAGAVDRAGPRMQQCISKFKELLASSLNRMGVSPSIVAWSGRMGGDWLDGFEFEQRKESPKESTAQDTSNLVHDLLEAEVDVILYAGGDGTTRDIVNALDGNETPLIGVPGGVKMHSGCFATTPKASAEVLLAFLQGDLMVAITEVMDLDEETYQKGEWKVRMYGEAWTPSSPRFMQGAKEQVERASESDTIEGLANHIGNLIDDNPELMVIWGSGGTLRRMGEHLNVELTLLGIDIQHNGTIHSDLNEQQLLQHLVGYEGPRLLLLSPMGGQGFLIGRGNLQLSPDVLRAIGFESILGVATPSKLLGLSSVRIDTGDPLLDEEYQQRRFVKLLQGYRTTRVIRILES
jgi:predicted polyphosphate/ATP-dependent NAD kinase